MEAKRKSCPNCPQNPTNIGGPLGPRGLATPSSPKEEEKDLVCVPGERETEREYFSGAVPVAADASKAPRELGGPKGRGDD